MTQHAMPFVPASAGQDYAQELRARLGGFADRPRLILALACLLLLVPFLSKPLHIDDPMYVWTAERIRVAPLDPYGFSVNWRATVRPMVQEMKNPPLVCYYLAAAMTVLGSSEQALHLALLLPAVGVILGTYQLARELSDSPELAAAATLATPVFLLSASSVMCDIAMTCSFVWAVWFWIRGLRQGRAALLVIGSVLIGVAALTKYFGVALFPLLIAYTLIARRGVMQALRPLLAMLIPLAILVAYEMVTRRAYGVGLLSDAMGFATSTRWGQRGAGGLSASLSGLAFTGGCCAAVALLIALAAPKRTAVVVAVIALIVTIVMIALDPLDGPAVAGDVEPGGWPLILQLALWSGAGAAVLLSVVAHAWTCRSSRDDFADAALLVMWVWGTFCFAVFVNWNVAARSILPLAPAAAIAAVRMCTRRSNDDARPQAVWRPWLAAVAPSLLLGVLLLRADASLAAAQRDAALMITASTAKSDQPDRTVWFTGNWGFQHYMQLRGTRAFDATNSKPRDGDLLVMPQNNLRLVIPASAAIEVARVELPVTPLLATMRPDLGAGFYSSGWGPLPFAFGAVPPERYWVLQLKDPRLSKN